MKKLTLLSILMLFISCSAEETVINNTTVSCTIQADTPEISEEAIPVWLQGSYKSIHLPEADLTIITENTIHLDLTGFETVYDISIEDCVVKEKEEYYKVQTNNFTIIFYRVNEPNMSAIRITYIIDTTVFELGYFNEVN